MKQIEMKNLEVYLGTNHVLKGINFEILKGEKVAIVGNNGSGKTTILNLLSGKIKKDRGEVFVLKNTEFGMVEQIPDFEDDILVRDVINLAFEKAFEVKSKMLEIEKLMENSTLSLEILNKYGQLQEKFELLGGYEIENRIFKVCTGLKITQQQLNTRYNLQSGGEKTRILLGMAILREPDVLLLDEPTNHLDVTSIEWLEEFARKYKGTLIIVSHDRYFLDNVVTRIIEIEDGKAVCFQGNYSRFQEQKSQIIRIKEKENQIQRHNIRKMEATAKMLHAWGNKADSGELHFAASSLMDEAQDLKKAMRQTMERKIEEQFSLKGFSSQDVIVLNNASKYFGNRCILKEQSLLIKKGEVVAIVGENGSGKSTVLKILMKEVETDVGVAKLGEGIKVAYLPQNIEFENGKLSIIETLRNELCILENKAISLLIKFNFLKEDWNKSVFSISGGERIRLKICILMQRDVNLLLLDEPTNHLDFKSREWLENSLEEFGGTLVFVTHDRYFANRFASRVLEIGDGKILDFKGDYSYYREMKNKDLKPSVNKPSVDKSAANADLNKNVSVSHNLKVKEVEEEIKRLEKEQNSINLLLKNEIDYMRLCELTAIEQDIDNRIQSLMIKWYELSESGNSKFLL